jgi:hypothetical protein
LDCHLEQILDAYLFEDLEQLCQLSIEFIWAYNNEWPHDATFDKVLREFLMKCGNSLPTAQVHERTSPQFNRTITTNPQKWSSLRTSAPDTCKSKKLYIMMENIIMY